MTFYSSTVNKPARESDLVDVKFLQNETHHICVVPWEHGNSENLKVKVTNRPFKVELTSHDMLAHHRLSFTLDLLYEVLTLEDVSYTNKDKEVRIHIPKTNMVKRTKETVILPRKK